MAMDELTMLGFVGIYFLLLGGFIYNFYLSKRLYQLLENMGEIVALSAGIPSRALEMQESTGKGTMRKLLEKGMELEKAERK